MAKIPTDMPALATAVQASVTHVRTMRSHLLVKLPTLLLVAFVAITLLSVFVPLNPEMPHSGISESWILPSNEAVARHLRFGKEFLNTVGPYASIYTRSYHPATDRLMLLGSLLIGVSYVISLLYLADGRKPKMVVILTLFCATFYAPDTLLLSYPFLLVTCALKVVNSKFLRQKSNAGWRQVLEIVILFSALGLLPLIKGSLLFPVGVATVMVCGILLERVSYVQVIPLLVIPLASAVSFWILAGQSPSDIAAFLRGTRTLISGYTEAMSSPRERTIGYVWVLAYLSIVSLFAWSILRTDKLNIRSKCLLGLLCMIFLAVAFKHGFVRTDHQCLAFAFLFIGISIVSFLYTDRFLIGLLILVFVLVVGTYIRQDPQFDYVRRNFESNPSVGASRSREASDFFASRLIKSFAHVTYESTWSTYRAAWKGLRLRLTDSEILQNHFTAALASIRDEHAIPVLQGTADEYTNDESYLLASSNRWDPRPITYSYSAYTPALAKLNEQHLRNSNAPNWVLLDLVTLDGRLPSLDDGLSWLAMLENYTFNSFDGKFVLLTKNSVIESRSRLDVIYDKSQKIGETVDLPKSDRPIFAEVDLKPTVFGKALIALYKPPMLNIVLNLRSGSTRTYRVISNMMASGFLLSPLVADTADFASFAVGNRRLDAENRVESIRITPSYGGSIFWSGSYSLRLETESRLSRAAD